jgi:hypothetical protein
VSRQAGRLSRLAELTFVTKVSKRGNKTYNHFPGLLSGLSTFVIKVSLPLIKVSPLYLVKPSSVIKVSKRVKKTYGHFAGLLRASLTFVVAFNFCNKSKPVSSVKPGFVIKVSKRIKKTYKHLSRSLSALPKIKGT